jgi:GNAT superfamily N-acetyltransferase
VTFVFVEKRPRADENRHSWEPFADSDEFNQDWWCRQVDPDDPYLLFEVWLGETEVARLDLEPGVVIDEAYAVAELGATTLEIGFFEVARSLRHRGIGSRVVRALAARHPDRRLIAFSEEADDFWASLGWQPYHHPDGSPTHRTLFVQPAP